MSDQPTLIPVILSGGTGSRLWPASRASHPKPFFQLADGETLLQKTFARALALNPAEIFTITNANYYLKTQAEYNKFHRQKPTSQLRFLLEPFGRNTAPALTLATLSILQDYDTETVIIALPADHLIKDIKTFTKYCQEAITVAHNQKKIVTFGIKPTHPETGFGYIQTGALLEQAENCYAVKYFIEKPDIEIAESFFHSKDYYWNAGIFCFTVQTFLTELAKYTPTLLTIAQNCLTTAKIQELAENVVNFNANDFAELPNISIDYALLEKTSAAAVLPCYLEWQDIGSWESFQKLHQKDINHNTLLAETILIDAKNNFIQSQNRLVAGIGIENLTIIDTPDALLVTAKNRTQDVRQIVDTLKEQAHPTYVDHCTVMRPWGSYTVLEEGICFKIKRIIVHPGCALSLQMHQQRSEHWVVVQGTATVQNGDREYILQINESTFIPMQTRHRLSNMGENELIIIEVQTGNYLGEDDIIRFADNYSRQYENSYCL